MLIMREKLERHDKRVFYYFLMKKGYPRVCEFSSSFVALQVYHGHSSRTWTIDDVPPKRQRLLLAYYFLSSHLSSPYCAFIPFLRWHQAMMNELLHFMLMLLDS